MFWPAACDAIGTVVAQPLAGLAAIGSEARGGVARRRDPGLREGIPLGFPGIPVGSPWARARDDTASAKPVRGSGSSAAEWRRLRGGTVAVGVNPRSHGLGKAGARKRLSAAGRANAEGDLLRARAFGG